MTSALGPGSGGRPVRLDVDLPVRHPFDAAGVMRFVAARAVTGVEVAETRVDGSLRYARTLALAHGPAAVEVLATEQVEQGGTRWQVRARLELASAADADDALAAVRRLLDLGADPAAVDAALSADAWLRPLVEAVPGVRVPGAVDPDELVVRALVGQQISVGAATTHLSRLADRLGSRYVSAVPGLDRLFPTAAQLADGLPAPEVGEALDPDRALRLPGRSVRSLVATARALADGSLVVHEGVDPEVLRRDLLARPGIGPWTASYVAMRVLADPDAWLTGDVALVAGARAVGVLGADVPVRVGHALLAAHAQAWAPWRSYAAMHLWQVAARPSTA